MTVSKRKNNRRGMGILAVTGLVAMAIGLGGCGKTRAAFGLARSAPDEFAVVTRAPLSMPPDYGLRPPTPGLPRPQERDVREEARRLLITSGASTTVTSDIPSAGEAALLNRAGAADANPDIRRLVSLENKVLASGDEGFVDRLIFWKKSPPRDSAIDPTREARRLSENAAMGDAVTKGPTPVIVRKKRGLFEGIF